MRSMGKRPFKILGVQQIAIGGLDKKPLREFWIDTLGLSDEGSYRSESENVDEDTHQPEQLWSLAIR